LGASVTIENCSLRGEKINSGCGALYPDYVKHSMAGTDTVLGFSFDGDADRLSVVYGGEVIDGDSVLYNISRDMTLYDNVVVGTVLSNLALEKQLAREGRRLVRTPVGDKYICDLMFKKNYNLGGEQSGHYIVYPAATTGDGILSAIFFCKSVYGGSVSPGTRNGKGSLSGGIGSVSPGGNLSGKGSSGARKLALPKKLELCPQKAISEFADPSIMYNKKLLALIDEYTDKLSGKGRIIVRMSGTEPKIRVMAECEDAGVVDEVIGVFRKFIREV
jgi:phosphoglucosamine mutase